MRAVMKYSSPSEAAPWALRVPSVFKLREFLNFLAVDCAGIRKYVVPLNSDSEVFQFNFEAKERLDLIDTDVTKLSNK